jgi:hypothetical protein
MPADVFYNPPALVKATFVPVAAVGKHERFLPQSFQTARTLRPSGQFILFLTGFYGAV